MVRRKAKDKAKEQLVWCEQCQAHMPPDHRDAVASAIPVVAQSEVR